jgi:AcrR family transcriptional regulator
MRAEPNDRPNELRERIVDATLSVIRQRGLARTSTSAIAEAAGCAEGSIYRYFSGKPDLLREVVRSRLPVLADRLEDLSDQAGTATVRESLRRAALALASSCDEFVPLAAALFSDAELLVEQRRLYADDGAAPDHGAATLAAYLRAEQELGRVASAADVDAAARFLLDACLGEAFLDALLDRQVGDAGRERRASEVVELVLRELEPR